MISVKGSFQIWEHTPNVGNQTICQTKKGEIDLFFSRQIDWCSFWLLQFDIKKIEEICQKILLKKSGEKTRQKICQKNLSKNPLKKSIAKVYEKIVE